MPRYSYLIISILICILPTTLNALKTVSVIVLPFEVNAKEEQKYLETEIPDVIGNILKQEGAVLLDSPIEPGMFRKEDYINNDNIRKLGLESGADYMIWGSITWIGQRFSLDVKMLDVIDKKIPNIFSIQGQGVESFPAKVKELTIDISNKLFKRQKITKILVKGNKRIEADAIKRIIKTSPGDIYLVKNLSKDLKAIYSMGYFEDVVIESEDEPDGKTVIFRVKEKSTIRFIRFKGNKLVFKDDKIKENLTIKTGSILNIFKIQNNIRIIEDLYKDKNYHNINVTYKTYEKDNNQADLEFIIEEGNKVRIENIIFIGNEAFSSKKLKKIMKSSEKGFFYWLWSSGNLKMEDLTEDTARIAAFYHDHGYIQIRVGEPVVEIKKEQIDITIKIMEGSRFKVGKVSIDGDLILSKNKLYEKLKIKEEEYFNRMIIRSDILNLMDLYSNKGYAYVDVSPRVHEDLEKLEVNITYVIKMGKQVYFEEIIITGNTTTRDKVIRRQLDVYEQELYSGIRLKRSISRLQRLDYFEDIKVNNIKGSSDDKMLLKINVIEKPTGTFSFGGGYSTTKKFYTLGSISNKNLFGRGQIIDLKAEIGQVSNMISLSFTEPWLFDIPLSTTERIYKWNYEYDTYDKDSFGGSIGFGYPVYEYTRLSVFGSHDSADLEITDEDFAPLSIRRLADEFEGDSIITNTVGSKLVYDSRNKRFCPTGGANHQIMAEYAGLGGDIGFTRFTFETGWYFPIYKKFEITGFLHAAGGRIYDHEGEVLPDYELFSLGGINSLRGFEKEYLAMEDIGGNLVGGDKFIQFNVEVIFPILRKSGINGVLFFDAGQLADSNSFNSDYRSFRIDNMRESAGGGIRWNSPMGLIRLEYGYILDPKEGEDKGKWEFAMGGAF